MKIKFIAAPLVAGALMVPATLSTPAAQAAVPTIPAVSSNTADAHKCLQAESELHDGQPASRRTRGKLFRRRPMTYQLVIG